MSYRNEVKEVSKVGGLVVVFVAILIVGIGAVTLFGERLTKPFREETRYQTQQNSQAYRDGLRQQINQMALDYATADGAEKNSILSVARSQFGSLDKQTLDGLQEGHKAFLREAGIMVD